MSQKRKPFSQQRIDNFVLSKKPKSDVNKNDLNSNEDLNVSCVIF